MNVLIRSVVCGLLLTSGVAGAQTVLTQQDVEARLQKAPFLMLRGRYAGTQLNFDAQGNLIGTANPSPLTLCAVLVNSVRLSDAALEIDARRASLEFGGATSWNGREKIRAVALDRLDDGKLTISIARDPQQPQALDAAIDKVFAPGLDDAFADSAPGYWQPWLRHQLHPDRAYPVIPPGVERPGGGVSPPYLIYSPDPQFSQAARSRNYSGICAVQLVVDAGGRPRDIAITRPLGMGLDEYAVLAVSQYRFTPAKDHGRPVPVLINIEVNFQLR